MCRDLDSLLRLIDARISAAGKRSEVYLRDAIEVVVFGSVAVELDRPDSDIDVLVVGTCDSKLKTKRLDLITMTSEAVAKRQWRESELASHVNQYGVWIAGVQQWGGPVCVGQRSIEEKRLRVAAFLRRLPEVWRQLDPDYRIKYSLKVRRELQRLLLLESGVAVPATRVLDTVPKTDPVRGIVCDRLQTLVAAPHTAFRRSFMKMVITHWNGSKSSYT